MEEFETGHGDRVTVLHVNYDGTRILTASIDHKVKVWDRDRKTGERTLLDTFTAHDADIRDAKFLHPTLGSYIGTIAADLKFHLWTEDTSQAPNSGRRFRRIATILSGPRIPFSSMDFKTIAHVYTYLALIDRQGLLSIYEPTSPDDLKDWTLLDQFHVSNPSPHPPPSRGEETSFKVRFDQNPTPLPYINSVSDDDSQLSLVVSCLNDVKIYQSATNPNADTDVQGASGSHRLTFHECFRLPTHPALVRDVAWAPFNARGVDRIATACKDGAVRIFELGVSANPNSTASNNSSNNNNNDLPAPIRNQPRAPAQTQSSLTSAIASTNNPASTTINIHPSPRATAFPFTYHLASSPAVLASVHADAWSLAWDGAGQVLMSSGSDGVVKVWRKAVAGAVSGTGEVGSGGWMLFAEQGVEFAGDDDDDAGAEGEEDE